MERPGLKTVRFTVRAELVEAFLLAALRQAQGERVSMRTVLGQAWSVAKLTSQPNAAMATVDLAPLLHGN
jgi:hypothetical protein